MKARSVLSATRSATEHHGGRDVNAPASCGGCDDGAAKRDSGQGGEGVAGRLMNDWLADRLKECRVHA